MNITRHISLKDEYVENLKPYVEKNGGNFGAPIRDMISRADNRNAKINSSIIGLPLFKHLLTQGDNFCEVVIRIQ